MRARKSSPAAEKNQLKPWPKRPWCIPAGAAPCVARLEDRLALSEAPDDATRPTVTFDETSQPWSAAVRPPRPPKPGHAARFDEADKRHGTRTLCICCEPQAGWRHLAVTERRTQQDCAPQMQWLVDARYPPAEVIRLVMDHRNTPTWASLSEACAPAEAKTHTAHAGVPRHAQARTLVDQGGARIERVDEARCGPQHPG
jgi:hypothetical protein